MSQLEQLFSDPIMITTIQAKLPQLFQLAELDNMRDGKLGMEIGSARERILIALLIAHFGVDNVTTALPITLAETDVILGDQPISIKTLTSKNLVGVKLVWTVDAQKSQAFIEQYQPHCDILLAHINWHGDGAFYFKLPKLGTNPRGVELSTDALRQLASCAATKKIAIHWSRSPITNYTPYDRWVELWQS
jgi:Restriction endonuclease ThaI